jgi:dihydrofolate reductase
MILSHIVAVSRNFIIGRNNGLPWKMPSDAMYFHDITIGHVVIMGRKNYEANKKALPGRTNVVITRREDFHPPDAFVVHTIDEAIAIAAETGEEEAFIVGGGEIYKQTLDIVDRIYITVIDMQAEGDTSYPVIRFDDYRILSERPNKADAENPYNWTYYILTKK